MSWEVPMGRITAVGDAGTPGTTDRENEVAVHLDSGGFDLWTRRFPSRIVNFHNKEPLEARGVIHSLHERGLGPGDPLLSPASLPQCEGLRVSSWRR